MLIWLPLLLLSSWSSRRCTLAAPIPDQHTCPRYDDYARLRDHPPFSEGRFRLPYQRPVKECRKFSVPLVEETIERLRGKITDPDLFRLFENAYPNTLDTAVLWTGFAWENWENETEHGRSTEEDLAFVITGDM